MLALQSCMQNQGRAQTEAERCESYSGNLLNSGVAQAEWERAGCVAWWLTGCNGYEGSECAALGKAGPGTFVLLRDIQQRFESRFEAGGEEASQS